MRTLALVGLCALLPAASFAQEAAPTEDRSATQVTEVEHGLFFGVDAGGLFLFGPKGSATGQTGFTTGRTFSFNLGYEISDIISIAVLVMSTHANPPSTYVSDGPTAMTGDFSSTIFGATVKVSFYGHPDSNAVKRLYVYARAGGGYALMDPKNYFNGGDIVILGGAGIEYFTHLRHLSLGLDANFLFGVNHMGPGFTVTPNLRYTF